MSHRMNITGKKTRYKAFLLIELTVSLAVLGILLTCLVVSLYGFKTFNHYQLTRQRCTSAAQAQIDSITVTGRQISKEDLDHLWPGVTISIEQSDGTEQWKGLKLIKARATAGSFTKTVTIELSRYILPREEK